MPTYVKNADAWQEIAAGQRVFVKNGDAWQPATFLFVKNQGTWSKVYSGTDPQVSTYPAASIDAYRPQGWRGDGKAYQGSWGFGDHIGCFSYNWKAIQEQLTERPVVLGVRLRLARDPAHGIGSNIAALIWSLAAAEVNSNGGLVKSGQPNLINGTRGDYGAFPRDSGPMWVNLSTAYGERLASDQARGFGIAISESLSSTGGEDSEYGIFTDGLLEITSDYA